MSGMTRSRHGPRRDRCEAARRVRRTAPHELGFTDDERQGRLDTRTLDLIYDGVYRIGGAPATWRGDLLAACLGAPSTGAASHVRQHSCRDCRPAGPTSSRSSANVGDALATTVSWCTRVCRSTPRIRRDRRHPMHVGGTHAVRPRSQADRGDARREHRLCAPSRARDSRGTPEHSGTTRDEGSTRRPSIPALAVDAAIRRSPTASRNEARRHARPAGASGPCISSSSRRSRRIRRPRRPGLPRLDDRDRVRQRRAPHRYGGTHPRQRTAGRHRRPGLHRADRHRRRSPRRGERWPGSSNAVVRARPTGTRGCVTRPPYTRSGDATSFRAGAIRRRRRLRGGRARPWPRRRSRTPRRSRRPCASRRHRADQHDEADAGDRRSGRRRCAG